MTDFSISPRSEFERPPRFRAARAKRAAWTNGLRAIAALTLLSSAMVLAITGGIMYFWHVWTSPPLGWVWRHWSDIHSAASVFFLIAVITHIALNARAMARHAGKKRSASRKTVPGRG